MFGSKTRLVEQQRLMSSVHHKVNKRARELTTALCQRALTRRAPSCAPCWISICLELNEFPSIDFV